ncbi:MAG TPA: signal peptidase II, partial [Bacteroidota bacterium]|nr:signal peptidase II [Bacteroidota bacterium]
MVKGITLPAFGIDVTGFQLGSSRPILGDFLRLTYIENPGMAFGIDLGGKLFFSIFSIFACACILLYLFMSKEESIVFRTSLAMILGGAVGNLIDRVFYGVLFGEAPLFYGKVVDFLDVDFFNINLFGYSLSRWPVFNVADASVTCGVLLMLSAHRKQSRESVVIPETSSANGVSHTSTIVPASAIRGDATQSPTSLHK